jgi:CRP-like cAMP-binding protein
MKNKIVQYFSKISPLSDEEAEAIRESAVIKNFEKGTFLLREGHYSNDTYFVFEGLVRQYNLVDGQERTSAFFTEDQWVMALNNLNGEKPSANNWICEEDCSLMIGNDDGAKKIFKQFPRLEGIARKILESTFSDYQQTIANYMADSPLQRYLRLVESRPELIQRIPQYHLASYIGIQPESLSRIRKRLMKK